MEGVRVRSVDGEGESAIVCHIHTRLVCCSPALSPPPTHVQCRGVAPHPTGCGLQGLYDVSIRSLSGAMQFVDTPHLAEGGLAALGGGCLLQRPQYIVPLYSKIALCTYCCCVQERDEALATLECVRADLQRRDDTITQLSFELEAARSQSKSLRGEVEELGRLREELIDRVERLHAEKHKLEDRVVQAEQHAQVGEGEGGEGRRGGETEEREEG